LALSYQTLSDLRSGLSWDQVYCAWT